VAAPTRELAHGTVGILGLGGVGREVAWRARALGARVIGLKRRRSDSTIGDRGSRADGVEVVYGAEGLATLASESDYLIVTAPHTEDTRGMVSREVLGLMKSDAVVINVSRGALIDEAALVEALRAGRLRGAGLDVFSVEPLPEDHDLWDLPNVVITPHVSPVTRGFWRREVDLIVENVGRLLSGMPLRNLVDKRAGY
jgi:phosphoglycerate dehydrogenase-like enzyme